MIIKSLSLLTSVSVTLFAALSSSTNYNLNNYSIGPGGTNNSTSTTYSGQATVGVQSNATSSSSNYTSKNGSIGAQQLNIPGAPTLSLVSTTYMTVKINTSNNPSDTVYSIAVSTNGFSTTSYMQADGTINSTAVYQTYSAWGSGTGTVMVGLSSATTYSVKVDAKQGQFTNTAYSAVASATTITPSVTFSVSPNTLSMSNLIPGSPVTSPNISFSFATNAANGGSVYVSGQNGGLNSSTQSYTIAGYTGNLSGQSEGFGVQAGSASQSSGGPFTVASPYNGTGNTVGAETSTPTQMIYSNAAITGGTANANVQAITSSGTPTSTDYQEVLTFLAAASF